MSERKNFLREVVVLLIIAALVMPIVSVTADTKQKSQAISITNNPVQMDRPILFQDDFESYADFVINFPPWTNIDVDGSPTFGSSLNDWPNEGEPQAFIIFNPSMTTPPWTDPNIQPHSGAKFAGCFNDNNVGYISDDWLITPLLGPANYDEVSFWAKSFNNQYNLEHFQVGISTTDTNPASFTIITPPPYVVAPYEQWNLYTYNLDNYDNQAIYIGIHMMSVDSWLFMVDDFQVTYTEHILVPKLCCEGSLSWENVKPRSTVTGDFQVCNCGDNGSLLNWEIDSYPTSWGVWTFTPSSGTGLEAPDCVTVSVEIIAPSEKNKEFNGTIKIVNTDDPTNFCVIDVYLKTPRDRSYNIFNAIIQKIIARYPNMFPILRHLLDI